MAAQATSLAPVPRRLTNEQLTMVVSGYGLASTSLGELASRPTLLVFLRHFG